MKINAPSTTAFLIALAVCIAYIFWYQNFNQPLTSKEIVAFELAAAPEKASALLEEWGSVRRDKLLTSIYLDFIFIVLYTLAIGGADLWGARFSGSPWFARYAPAVAVGVACAGLSDVVENIAMIWSLQHGPAVWSAALAAGAAYVKFALLGVGLLFFVATLARRAMR